MKGITTMKSYEIIDSENLNNIGIILYYEKNRVFIIELNDSLDEWSAPLLFSGLVKKGIFTVPRDISLAWVNERIIPNSRQNIDAVLSNHHLKEYDEMKLLELSEGRCSQDSLFIRKTDILPDYVTSRMNRNLVDFVLLDNNEGLCFFADDTVKIIFLSDFEEVSDFLSNHSFIRTGQIGCGGYYLTFNDSVDIPAEKIYKLGMTIPLKRDDFITFLDNILDTSESCKLLNCSRQNLSYLVKQKQLTVAKPNVNGNLFMKGDVLRNQW